jgi:hypothetical protein
MGRFGIGRTIFDEIFYETLEDRWGEDAQERFVVEFISKYRQSVKIPSEIKSAGSLRNEILSRDDNALV